MSRIRTVGVLLLLSSAGCGPRPAAPPFPRWAIDTLALRAHTAFLSSDLLEGRGTGERGAAVAAAYLATQCRELGLTPLGDRYLLDVRLETATPRAAETVLRIERGPDTAEFRVGEDFLAIGGRRSALRSFRGTPVYLGTADDIRRAADSLPDLHGRVAVTGGVLRPDLAARVADRGPAGIVYLTADTASYRLYRASRGEGLTLLADSSVPSSFHLPVPALVAGPQVVPALAAAIRDHGTLDARLAFDRRPIRAWNVACLLPGRDERVGRELIALAAHYDHLGIGPPDERGDSIYNGFSDNSAGAAMLLAVARAIRSRPPAALRRGLALLFFTGEERGLLGSDHFVAHPPVPLDSIRALVNLDAGAPPARPWNWRVAGGEGTELGRLAADAAAMRGWAATLSPATPNSDYFPFAREGVPAIFLIPGTGAYEGLSADSSQALFRRWDRYHRADDEYDDEFPFAGMHRYAEYALMVVQEVDRR
jgi:nitroreductase